MRNIILLVSLFAASCTHSVHMVGVSGFEPYSGQKGGKMVSARSEQFVILGFAGDTNYVDEALRKLVAQCPNGTISGITTQYLTSHGFFSWHNKILLQGLCQG